MICMKLFLSCLCLGLVWSEIVVAGPSAPASNWGPHECAGGTCQANTDKATLSQACEHVAHIDFPIADQPTIAQKRQLNGCISAHYYYGLDHTKRDWEKARHCAFIEHADGDAVYMGGSQMLLMIYANGEGVARNLDLALKMACSSLEPGEGSAGSPEMVLKILTLKTKPACNHDAQRCHDHVDICEFPDSTAMGTACANVASTRNEQVAMDDIKKFISTWPTAHQSAYRELEKAANHYFTLHADNEIDLSGTARAMIAIEDRDDQLKAFRTAVQTFEAGERPHYSHADFMTADKNLNHLYRQKITKDKFNLDGGPTAAGIKMTQKAWLSYRDAWARFAALRYPDTSLDSIKT